MPPFTSSQVCDKWVHASCQSISDAVAHKIDFQFVCNRCPANGPSSPTATAKIKNAKASAKATGSSSSQRKGTGKTAAVGHRRGYGPGGGATAPPSLPPLPPTAAAAAAARVVGKKPAGVPNQLDAVDDDLEENHEEEENDEEEDDFEEAPSLTAEVGISRCTSTPV